MGGDPQALEALTRFAELGLCRPAQLRQLAQRIAPLLCHPGIGTAIDAHGMEQLRLVAADLALPAYSRHPSSRPPSPPAPIRSFGYHAGVRYGAISYFATVARRFSDVENVCILLPLARPFCVQPMVQLKELPLMRALQKPLARPVARRLVLQPQAIHGARLSPAATRWQAAC